MADQTNPDQSGQHLEGDWRSVH